ncbi:MAG: NUDIX domain-containing protein [Candidatus Paceibacterota bacterium]
MSDQKISRTASLLILNSQKILLLLRDDRKDLPGSNTWGLIGGFIEAGENEEEAARREAKEEAGIGLEKLCYVGTHEYANGRISTTYLTVINDEEAQKIKLGDEGQEIKFFSFGELAHLPLSGTI